MFSKSKAHILGLFVIVSAFVAALSPTASANDVWVDSDSSGVEYYIVEESISGTIGKTTRGICVEVKEVKNGTLKRKVHHDYSAYCENGRITEWHHENPRAKVSTKVWGWDKILNYCLSYLDWPNYDGGRP